MTYKAKVAVCSELRPKHSTQSEHHVQFLNVKTWWNIKKPLGFKRLIYHWLIIFLWGQNNPGVSLTTYLHLVPNLKISGATPPRS